MAEAIIYDKRKIVACSALCSGQYGIDGLYVGVPVILGKNGIEKIIEVDLTADEKVALDKSAAAVRKTCEEAEELLAKL